MGVNESKLEREVAAMPGCAVLDEHEKVTYPPPRTEPPRSQGTVIAEHLQALKEARAMLTNASQVGDDVPRYQVTADAVARLACSIVRGWAEVRHKRERERARVGPAEVRG